MTSYINIEETTTLKKITYNIEGLNLFIPNVCVLVLCVNTGDITKIIHQGLHKLIALIMMQARADLLILQLNMTYETRIFSLQSPAKVLIMQAVCWSTASLE